MKPGPQREPGPFPFLFIVQMIKYARHPANGENLLLPMTDTNELLEKYGITRDTTQKYIDAITRLNQTETADEIQVSRDTINRYKKAFQEMTSIERMLIIASLAQDKLLRETTTER